MSAFSISEPFPTFSDRNGQPLEAGYLYFGVAGLDPVTNPVTVYWDAALTIPAAQPVRTLNGYPSNNGTASRLYVNAGDFSTSVRDSKNTLVFTALNSTLRIPASSITGQFDASQVDYTQGDTGSQTRTVESRLQDSVSVFDFMTPAQIAGVKAGTFLFDVTTAIAAAIASPVREIYFPQGGYLVDNGGSGLPAIYIPPNTVGKTLRGAGRQATVIRNAGNGAAIASEGTPIIANTSILVADMSVEGSVGTTDGIIFTYTAQSVIERVDCYAHGNCGIRVINGAHVSVVDAWCRSNTVRGLEIGDDAYFVDVRGGTFQASAAGVAISRSTGVAPRYITFTGSAFRNNTNANVEVGDARDVRFFGCSFEQPAGGPTARHLSVNGGAGLASSVVVDGCSFYGINAGATTIGVYADKCEDVAILNSVLDCNGAVAYDVKVGALRPKFLDNSVIIGTRTNASTSLLFRNNEATEVVQTSAGTIFRLAFEALANAFRFTSPTVGGTPWPVLRLGDWRLWFNAGLGQLMMKGSADPATLTDGYVVGPGLKTYTVGTLPPGAPDGTMAIITDNLVAPVWGAAPAAGGVFKCAVIHWGGGSWTIIGK